MVGDKGATLRLLSLDGGGVRGMAALLVLEKLMRSIRPNNPPKPCEVFDVIAGTSTGGLLAVLLGRLEMDIVTCIEAYKDLSETIFTQRQLAHLKTFVGKTVYSARNLRKSIEDLVEAHTGDKDTPFLVAGDRNCKVFVCSTASGSRPVRLRSYQSNDGIYCKIWQAARATTANPEIFAPVQLDDGSYLAGGEGCPNNPIRELIDEVSTVFPSRPIGTIVSIGTGGKSVNFLEGNIPSIAKACMHIATESERTELDFRQVECGPGGRFLSNYFRFNVDQDLQKVSLQEWKELDMISKAINQYLQRETKEYNKCVSQLKQTCTTPKISRTRTNSYGQPREISTADRSLDNNESQMFQPSLLGYKPVGYFAPRDDIFDDIDRYFSASSNNVNRALTLTLVGHPGVGKTRAMLEYGFLNAEYYCAVFWVECRSEDSIQKGFSRIAQLLNIGSWRPGVTRDDTSSWKASSTNDDAVVVKEWLGLRKRPWLLMFDGADDLSTIELLPQYLPVKSTSKGNIIITSRRAEAYRLGPCIRVGGLSAEAAANLMFSRLDITEGFDGPSDEIGKSVNEICRELRGHPLAIDLAGAHLKQTGFADHADDYLKSYLRAREYHSLRVALGREKNCMELLAAWDVSLNALQLEAANLLRLLCFFDPQGVPLDLFRQACLSKALFIEGMMGNFPASKIPGIQPWLFAMFKNDDDSGFLDAVQKLSSYFFLTQEIIRGTWNSESGVARLDPGGFHAVIRIPHAVRRVCSLFSENERVQFSLQASNMLISAFEPGIEARKPGPSYRRHAGRLYLGAASAVSDSTGLISRLEQLYKHLIVALSAHATKYDCLRDTLPDKHSRARSGWAIIFAFSLYDPPTTLDQLDVILSMADTIAQLPKFPTTDANAIGYWITYVADCWQAAYPLLAKSDTGFPAHLRIRNLSTLAEEYLICTNSRPHVDEFRARVVTRTETQVVVDTRITQTKMMRPIVRKVFETRVHENEEERSWWELWAHTDMYHSWHEEVLRL